MKPKKNKIPGGVPAGDSIRYPLNRRRSRAGRRESEAYLMFALEASNTGVWDLDLADRKILRSPEHDRIFGYASLRPEWTYQVFLEHVLPEDRTEVDRQYQQAMENRGDWNIECRIRRADGEIRWIRTAGRHRLDMQGKPRHITGIVQDITDRKKAEAQLEALLIEQQHARDELERRVAERTTELKRRADQLARLASELTMAEQQVRRHLADALHDHLQQILVAARIQTDQLQLDEKAPERIRNFKLVHEMLSEAIASTRSLSRDLSPPVLHHGGLPAALQWLAEDMQQKHNLKVHLQADGNHVDLPDSLNIFIYNTARELLFNITKHADTLDAAVRLHRRGDSILLEVADSGKGFDPSCILRSNAESGGFGLFSIQERVDFLGGRLAIDSRIGGGSRFSITVPVTVPRKSEAAPMPETGSMPATVPGTLTEPVTGYVRVLLVDDHRMMREGLISLLQGQSGIEVVGQADNGRQAIECVETLQPDVVTMDVSMPVMDGIEATRVIKERWPNIRVIGLSMFEEAELASRMRAAGADHYLAKTGPSQLLIEAIRTR